MKYLLVYLVAFLLAACGGAEDEPEIYTTAFRFATDNPQNAFPSPLPGNPRFYIYADGAKINDECGIYSPEKRHCLAVTWPADPQRLKKVMSTGVLCDLEKNSAESCLKDMDLRLTKI